MIARITITSTRSRARPRIGDRKLIKGVLHERRQDTVRLYGQLHYVVNNGRPVCSWVRVP
jgi:hypothetical protein